eukprot:scaffold662924_cov38-Prasinocladus_malaysianus.AAC.1
MGRMSGREWPHAVMASSAISELGANHVEKDSGDAYVDDLNQIVTAPGYMNENAAPHEVFDGVGQMIEGVKKETWISLLQNNA